MKTNKSYSVKEWFANKVANEIRRNISMCEVFAVMKESEKAVYAMLNLGCNFKKCMWIPKSVLIENEIGERDNGTFNHETLFIENYNDAVKAFESHWELYK